MNSRRILVALMVVLVPVILWGLLWGKYGIGPEFQAGNIKGSIGEGDDRYEISKFAVGTIGDRVYYGMYTTNGAFAFPGYLTVVVLVDGIEYRYLGDFSYPLSRLVGDRVLMKPTENFSNQQIAQDLNQWVELCPNWKFFVDPHINKQQFIDRLLEVGFTKFGSN